MFARSPTASLLAAAVVVALGWNAFCSAGHKVTLGLRLEPGQLVSIDEVSHEAWSALLQQYVDDQGNVAYARWKGAHEDMRALDRYLNSLSAADPRRRATRASQLAFWINAYNAVTIRGILREYPTSSIRNHTAKAFGYNIWKDLQLYVGGKPYHLEQMEHELLRKMGEPRIHFAIVCASRSCPRLLNRAYVAENLNDQLTTNAKAFFAHPGNFRHEPQRRRFWLSSILKWFGADFGDSQAARLRAIAPYLPTRQAYDAAVGDAVSVSYLRYDWGLNDQSAK